MGRSTLYVNRVVSFAVALNGYTKIVRDRVRTNYKFHTCESIFIGGTFAKNEGLY